MATADLLQMYRQVREEVAEAAATKLPRESFSTQKGFTWADVLRSVDCDTEDKQAVCVVSTMATIVTSQVVTKEDTCDFIVRVREPGGEEGAPIIIGVVSDVPSGFQYLPIGHPKLPNSIGICAYPGGGQKVHDGKIQGSVPGIKSGDTLKIQVQRGSNVSIWHGSTQVLGFQVVGDGAFRCAASLSSKGQHVEILDRQGQDASAAALRQLMEADPAAAALMAGLAGLMGQPGDDAASRLPVEKYSQSKGFTFVDALQSVDCDARDKVATCTISRTATMVTSQVLTNEDHCDFLLRVVRAGGDADGPLFFGVVDDVPTGFGIRPVGDRAFQPSIGACCARDAGFIITGGEKKGSFPGVRDGELVKVCVSPGSKVSLLKDDDSFSFTVGGNGKFRIGVTFTSKGQQAEIVDVPVAGGEKAMKVGYVIDMPTLKDPRLESMRTKFSREAMADCCNQVATVVKVSKRCVRTSINGREFWWDIELFPSTVRRCCHEGCDLSEMVTSKAGHCCDVCLVRIPDGAHIKRCNKHDYDVCRYCQGLIDTPEVGSKVIRGPSWKWMDQDGTAYNEGVCTSLLEECDGWIAVKWAGDTDESSYRYRVSTYYQDVWPAKRNGLVGQTPVQEPKESDSGELRRKLLSMLKDVADALPKASLPSEVYSAPSGFTFAAGHVPEVTLEKGKKDARAERENPLHWASLVTEQVVEASTSAPAVFTLQIKALPLAAKGIFAWGLCTEAAMNFQRHLPGASQFKGSIGCVVTPAGQAIVHEDDVKGKFGEVSVGDVVGARVHNGKCEFLHQGRVIHAVGIGGRFRFAVCLGAVGQHVCIIQGDPGRNGGSIPLGLLDSKMAKIVPTVDLGPNGLRYSEQDKLGEGGFGVVYRGNLWGTDVVVKKMRQEAMSQELEQNFEKEVQALAALRHINLVTFMAINVAQLLIVTEFCELGDLKKYLTQGSGVSCSVNDRRLLMLDVSKGMAFIAGRGMVHRDLKPENVLISNPGPVAKVGDFGLVLALAQCSSESGAAGTMLYMAPEAFLGEVSEKSDVYSFSLVLGFTFGMKELDLELFTGMMPRMLLAQFMQDAGPVHQLIIERIRDGKRPQIPQTMPKQIAALVAAAWDPDVANRPTFVSICELLTQPLADSIPSQAVARPVTPPIIQIVTEEAAAGRRAEGRNRIADGASTEEGAACCCTAM